ncbi:MAG: hypothetical protein HRU38_23365 [Saccharospirillaceae bacterium]|nr:hypothetical protein [Saccharospirillaceae bacterium]
MSNQTETKSRNIAITVTAVLFMIFFIFAYYQKWAKTPESTIGVGEFTSFTVNTGIGIPTTTVQTTKGSFPVRGAFFGLVGELITLEQRINGDVYLCAKKLDQCNVLLVSRSVKDNLFNQIFDELQ